MPETKTYEWPERPAGCTCAVTRSGFNSYGCQIHSNLFGRQMIAKAMELKISRSDGTVLCVLPFSNMGLQPKFSIDCDGMLCVDTYPFSPIAFDKLIFELKGGPLDAGE